ncbi:hypothetical protein V6N13_134042 [Hibiscus sabdariffa]|uniref:ATP-dependent RNA helicase Ski2/MTR4 C-terminal domain-containing protein n=1 Tax=Hibiscus sabdariffa TaxID=183260 RepID=A0ABR2QZD8_9ROSI
MVEAWASGLSWRELMMDCAMNEGDLARLLRRTIDLLAQIPKLPDIDPLLQKNCNNCIRCHGPSTHKRAGRMKFPM